MLEYFAAAKSRISETLQRVMDEFGLEYAAVAGDLGAGAAARIAEFSSRGKMLRGGLVRLGYDLAKGCAAEGDDDEALVLAGVAMELFQSGLLVHDDIMDRDRVRRGFPTVHVAYEENLRRGDYEDCAHHGEALGICAGDLAYFAAFRLLAGLPVSAARARAVSGIAARELGLVGIAQMQDVVNGAARPDSVNPFGDSPADPDEEAILKLYRFKTGRYTFSLPLAIGAAIAGAPDGIRIAFEDAGELLGVLFQLKDDELGLFADPALLGKPVGADIRENKKTLFRLRLFELCAPASRARLISMFGNRDSGETELAFVRAEVESLGIRSQMAGRMRDYATRAEEALEPFLAIAPLESSKAYRDLVAFSLERRS
ncbi:MAG: polyprenyl synthetase [Spirochaetae bacterium HGW-Spirochaetae-7]|jgi:geranylgeranyl diphosphate synthase type I|nr:MAG: polyprenyl synthetase [Spirochaetae bacterium HGW-Spirochaetae-7]